MGKRTLIVDDSSVMRKMIRETLITGGHEIAGEARSGPEAIEMYQSLKPDLVIMDITMRGMDGFTAAQEIIKNDKAARVLFLSNLNEARYGDNAQRLGAVGYVSKQTPEEILKLI